MICVIALEILLDTTLLVLVNDIRLFLSTTHLLRGLYTNTLDAPEMNNWKV